MISLRNSTPRYREAGQTIRPSVTWPARSAARANSRRDVSAAQRSGIRTRAGATRLPFLHFRWAKGVDNARAGCFFSRSVDCYCLQASSPFEHTRRGVSFQTEEDALKARQFPIGCGLWSGLISSTDGLERAWRRLAPPGVGSSQTPQGSAGNRRDDDARDCNAEMRFKIS